MMINSCEECEDFDTCPLGSACPIEDGQALDFSNVKPNWLGFFLCTVCERGDTPHVDHDGPYIVLEGEMLMDYWEMRVHWASPRAWYKANVTGGA